MQNRTLPILPALLLAATLPAQATIIDFTATTSSSVTSDGITATATAENGALTFETFNGDSSSAPCSSSLLACRYDGLGVNDDEITYGVTASAESVNVTFNQLVNVSNVYLFDLFGVNDDGRGNPAEVAKIQFYGTGGTDLGLSSVTGTAPPGTLSGYADWAGNVSGVSSIRFYTDQVRNSDFSLAGLQVSTVAVPEPGILSLLGAGLAVFGFLGRRRRRVTI
jgi:hypothetical protein